MLLLLQRSVRLLTPNYQSARFQSLRNSLQRVTPKITAPIKAATFSPNAGCSHSSDTPGCSRRKLGLQQVAEPDSRLLLAHPACQASGPFTTKVMRICVYVCVWSSETVSECPVPRSAATWSDALPTTASSQPDSSSTPHPAVPFKVKTSTVSGPQEALKPKLKCAWKISIWCL